LVLLDYANFIQQAKADLIMADERIAKQEIDIESYKRSLDSDKEIQCV
jgi:hypothetical protein